MSWVFLCPHDVLKLKKPVRYDFLDFSSLQARALYCREEVRLNRRLAPDVYLGVAPLLVGPDRALRIGPLDPLADAAPTAVPDAIDWLVWMRRLPRPQMLDWQLAHGRVEPADLDALADRLAAFYRSLPPVALDGATYLSRLAQVQRLDRAVLLDARFDALAAAPLLERFERAWQAHAAAIAARAAAVREGHGDLRPEHVALGADPVVIDCLEFNRTLRETDPFDELAFLGMECTALGAAWIGPRLIGRVAAALGDCAPPEVLALYAANRALLRARLAAAHLLEPQVRLRERWLPQAQRYLALAADALQLLPSR
ncbi:MAG: hypothetical protein N2688_12365 [Burkholderiaceae bacterium]|nr:hypothetical protein [Burkholderiaceae bacterium]